MATKPKTTKTAAKPAKSAKTTQPVKTVSRTTKPGKYLPFAIRFDLKGNAVVVDENGRVVKPTRVDYPEDTSSLINVQAISSVQVRSGCETKTSRRAATTTTKCYALVTCGGITYKIPVPCPK